VRGFATYGIGGFYEGLQSEPEQEKHNVYRVDPQTGSVTVVVEQHGATDLARRADGLMPESRVVADQPLHRSQGRLGLRRRHHGQHLVLCDLDELAQSRPCAEVKPAASTVERWRVVFLKLQDDFPNAAALSPEQARRWAEGLINDKRSSATARNIYVNACRIVFAWAIGKRLLTNNPFTGWRITVPKRASTRETKAFTDDEAIQS
jgi:hypothetical protein